MIIYQIFKKWSKSFTCQLFFWRFLKPFQHTCCFKQPLWNYKNDTKCSSLIFSVIICEFFGYSCTCFWSRTLNFSFHLNNFDRSCDQILFHWKKNKVFGHDAKINPDNGLFFGYNFLILRSIFFIVDVVSCPFFSYFGVGLKSLFQSNPTTWFENQSPILTQSVSFSTQKRVGFLSVLSSYNIPNEKFNFFFLLKNGESVGWLFKKNFLFKGSRLSAKSNFISCDTCSIFTTGLTRRTEEDTCKSRRWKLSRTTANGCWSQTLTDLHWSKY